MQIGQNFEGFTFNESIAKADQATSRSLSRNDQEALQAYLIGFKQKHGKTPVEFFEKDS